MSAEVVPARSMDPLAPADVQRRGAGIESWTERVRFLQREADLHDRVAERFMALGETTRADQERVLANQCRAAAERVTVS